MADNRTKATIEKENETLKAQNDDLAKIIKDMQAKLEKISSQPQINNETVNFNSKKIKVYSMLPNTYVLHSRDDYKDTPYVFTKFGQMHNIKFDELEKIVDMYREQAEKGWFYISDKKAVQELGLEDEYKNIYNMSTMKDIIDLKTQDHVDMIQNIDKSFHENLADLMAENINNGYKYDLNFLRQASDIIGFDVEKIANNRKIIQK